MAGMRTEDAVIDCAEGRTGRLVSMDRCKREIDVGHTQYRIARHE